MLTFRRALTAGVACLAAVAVAGCSKTGSSSSSAVTVTGNTLTIYISEPGDIHTDSVAQDIVDAEQLAYAADSKEVTDYKLELQTPLDAAKPSDNARAAIVDKRAIAYLGEIPPGTSDQTVGITNAVDLLQVSPTDNALELTTSTPAVVGAPQNYFEQWGTYGRTFARVVPSATDEARAQVAEMKALGVTKLYVSDDGSDYGKALADAVRSDAQAAGLALDSNISESVDGYFYGTDSPAAGAKFFNHIASMAPTAKLFGTSSLNSSAFTSALSAGVHHLYVSIPGYLSKDLPAAGKAFETAFRTAYHHTPNVQAIFGYEAMAAVLRAIQSAGKSANDRATVVKEFLNQRKAPSVLGTYTIDSGGNTSLDAFVFAHPSGGQLVPFTAAASQG